MRSGHLIDILTAYLSTWRKIQDTTMLKKVLFFFFCGYSFMLQAQSDTAAIGMVQYNQLINLQIDHENNGAAVLYFNQKKSLYVQYGAPAEDATTQTPEMFSVYVSGDKDGFPIYKDHRTRRILSKVPCYDAARQYCVLDDTLGSTKWTISPTERRRFGDYEAQKATGVFAGRLYEVWFLPDIPIPSGPHKLGGLPGLIVEAKTTDNRVQFLFVGLEIPPSQKRAIVSPSGKPLHMTYQESCRKQKERSDMIVKEMRAEGHDVSIRMITDRLEMLEDQ